MALSRRLRLVIATAGIFALLVLPAAAGEKLAIKDARDRAAAYADTTCDHDRSCANAGVRSCRRHRDRVVLCRIFDHRKTEEQGSFVCTRLVRLALDAKTGRIPVTGVSDWDC